MAENGLDDLIFFDFAKRAHLRYCKLAEYNLVSIF
jgi:hypothetical protein